MIHHTVAITTINLIPINNVGGGGGGMPSMVTVNDPWSQSKVVWFCVTKYTYFICMHVR